MTISVFAVPLVAARIDDQLKHKDRAGRYATCLTALSQLIEVCKKQTKSVFLLEPRHSSVLALLDNLPNRRAQVITQRKQSTETTRRKN